MNNPNVDSLFGRYTTLMKIVNGDGGNAAGRAAILEPFFAEINADLKKTGYSISHGVLVPPGKRHNVMTGEMEDIPNWKPQESKPKPSEPLLPAPHDPSALDRVAATELQQKKDQEVKKVDPKAAGKPEAKADAKAAAKPVVEAQHAEAHAGQQGAAQPEQVPGQDYKRPENPPGRADSTFPTTKAEQAEKSR